MPITDGSICTHKLREKTILNYLIKQGVIIVFLDHIKHKAFYALGLHTQLI